MSYFNPEEIAFKDGPNLDAFGRLRVSIGNTLFDSQQEYGLDLLRTWDATANGTLPTIISANGSVTSGSNLVGPRNSSTRMTPITCSSTDTHYSILQTKQYIRYIPGKSQLVFITGVFATGSGATASFVLRTSTSGSASDSNAVAQASWNIDTFDGTGPSGVTIDFTKTQILFVSAQWLGVGRVVVGFDVDGCLFPAHAFLNANVLTLPYCQTFNLPIRMEARTSGSSTIARTGYFDSDNGVFLQTTKATAGGTINFVCCSVQSEGGVESRGFPQSASGGITAIGVTTRRPVLSIRPRATMSGINNRGHIGLQDVNLTAATNNAYWELVVGGTLTGASWLTVGVPITAGAFVVGITYVILTVGTTVFTSIGASANTVGVVFTATGVGTGTGTACVEESIAEYDISATAISGGSSVIKGFVLSGSGATRGSTDSGIDLRNPLVLSKIDALTATQTPVTLVCTSFTGTSSITSAIDWFEQVI